LSRGRKLVNGLLLVLLGIVLACAVAEIGLRLLRRAVPIPYAEDPNPWAKYVGWARGPYLLRWYESKDTLVLLRYNSKGLRDVEHSYEKPPGVYRILVLGDSFAEAKEVELEQSFPRLLEEMLNQVAGKDGPRFEVINGGVAAWGTDQELLLYIYEASRYNPDLVLLDFTPNDVVNSYAPLESALQREAEGKVYKPYFVLEDGGLSLRNFPYVDPYEPSPATLDGFLYHHSVAYRVFAGAWGDMTEKIGDDLSENGIEEESERQDEPLPDDPTMYPYESQSRPEMEAAWRLMAALLGRLRAEAESRGAKLAVVANSTLFAVHPQARERFVKKYPELEGESLDWEKPYRQLAAILDGQGTPYLLLNTPFVNHAAHTGELLHFLKDGHYSPAGHRLAAHMICDWLVAGRQVPVAEGVDRCPPLPTDGIEMQKRLDARLNDDLELLGYDLEQPAAGQLELVLYWKALRDVQSDLVIAVRLVDERGEEADYWLGRPVQSSYPTVGWREGEWVRDPWQLTARGDIPAGEYELEVELYDAATESSAGKVRLPAPVRIGALSSGQ
jgi:hypothetical protein